MSLMTEGKPAGSPVYSTNRVGCVMLAAVLASDAFDDRPDQVDSQLSGEHRRPKPTEPKFDVNGFLPHSEPYGRSDGSSDRSKLRRSASVRQIVMISECPARRRSARLPPPLLRLRAAIRSAIKWRAVSSSRRTRS